MARARYAASAALVLLLLLGLSARGPSVAGPELELGPAAAVGWPPSAGLVVAEVVTGGASASDEYIELYNASATTADLAGLEVVYVTSSGATVTRKTAWTGSLLVEPGRHVLLANALGTFAGAADGTWSGGLAATGGAIVLRPIGGTPIDAVGWGDAVNGFVEGTAASAPAAGRSIERRPGGSGGNGVDTNDNAADFAVNPTPIPLGLAAEPVPTPTPTPTPTPSPTPTPTIAPTPPRPRRPHAHDRADPDTDPHALADPHAHDRADPDTDPHALADPHAHDRADPDADPHALADPHAHDRADPDADPHALADPHAHDRADPDADPHALADPHAGAHPGTGAADRHRAVDA